MPADLPSPKPVGQRKMKVFISNAAESRDVAALISSKLRQAGMEASNDQAEAPAAGTEMRGWLKSQIKSSDGVVVIVTPNTVDSQWMQYELGLASGMDRLVVPVVVDVANDRLPEPIGKRRIFRLDELDQVEQLIRQAGIEAASQHPAPASVPPPPPNHTD